MISEGKISTNIDIQESYALIAWNPSIVNGIYWLGKMYIALILKELQFIISSSDTWLLYDTSAFYYIR